MSYLLCKYSEFVALLRERSRSHCFVAVTAGGTAVGLTRQLGAHYLSDGLRSAGLVGFGPVIWPLSEKTIMERERQVQLGHNFMFRPHQQDTTKAN